MKERVYRFSDYLRSRFPFKVWKLPVDAGFTCPNRDGTKAWGGCTYCDNRSFSPPARDRRVSLRDQIKRGLALQHARGIEHVLVYFQAYTNTYALVEELRALYETALSDPEVVGLAIATRPDCLPNSTIELLAELARRTAVWVEVGIETSHNVTLTALNRAHTYAECEEAIRRTHGKGFEVVGHLIFGLPGETREMMFETVARVGRLPIDAVKLHHFYVAKGTVLETEHQRAPLKLFSFEEWIALAADLVQRLPSSMYFERVAGELSNPWLVAPRWGKSNAEVWAALEAELERRGGRQGDLVNPASESLRLDRSRT